MVHKIGSFYLECSSCKSTKAIDAKVYVRDKKSIAQDIDKDEVSNTKKLTDCPGCGADVEFKEQQISKICPYCDTPLVTEPLNAIKPYSILPFVVDKQSARETFKKWLGSLWFAPGKLKEQLDFEHKFRPVYIPYYSFDAKTWSSYSGERGDAYYVEVQREVYINGRYQIVSEMERRINWSYVSGNTARDFYDILVDAKSDLPEIVRNLRDFDINRLMLYNPSFLSGFDSFEYNRELEDCYNSAKSYMKSIIYNDVLYSIGGDEQRVHSINSNFSNEVYEVTMLPIWLSSFKYGNKEYDIVINAVTGEIRGERPYSYGKIFALIAFVVIVVLGLMYLDENYNFDSSPNTTLRIGY